MTDSFVQVNKLLGFYGNFGISGGVMIIGIFYHIFFVGEPMQRSKAEKTSGVNAFKFITKAFVTPIVGMKEMILKKRKTILKFLIFLQFLWFTFYWLSIEIKFMIYLFFV